MSATLADRSESMWNFGLPAGVASWAQGRGLTSQWSGRASRAAHRCVRRHRMSAEVKVFDKVAG